MRLPISIECHHSQNIGCHYELPWCVHEHLQKTFTFTKTLETYFLEVKDIINDISVGGRQSPDYFIFTKLSTRIFTIKQTDKQVSIKNL